MDWHNPLTKFPAQHLQRRCHNQALNNACVTEFQPLREIEVTFRHDSSQRKKRKQPSNYMGAPPLSLQSVAMKTNFPAPITERTPEASRRKAWWAASRVSKRVLEKFHPIPSFGCAARRQNFQNPGQTCISKQWMCSQAGHEERFSVIRWRLVLGLRWHSREWRGFHLQVMSFDTSRRVCIYRQLVKTCPAVAASE